MLMLTFRYFFKNTFHSFTVQQYSTPHIIYTVFSLILYAPKQITHVQTIISEHERNGAKWEVGHIAIYLTKRDGGGELGHGVCRGSSKREGFWEPRSDSVCMFACV